MTALEEQFENVTCSSRNLRQTNKYVNKKLKLNKIGLIIEDNNC